METKLINGTEIDKETAVLQNIGLARKIAYKYRVRAKTVGLEIDDLINIGAIGLMRAFEDYEVSKGYQFSTFASYKVLGEITRAIKNGYDRGVRYPVYVKDTASKIIQNGLESEPAAVIAERLNVKQKWAETAIEYLNSDNAISLDGKKRTPKDISNLEYHTLIGREVDLSYSLVSDFIATLNNREKDVASYLLAGYTHREIAERWGTSKSLVWHYTQVLKNKLSKYMEEDSHLETAP